MASLTDPLGPVVGAKAAKRLEAAFGLRTVGDLLRHYPRRYDTRGELTELLSLADGEHVTVQAEVASVSVRKMRNRPGTILEAVVTDGRGRLSLTFFGRGRQDWREKLLRPGARGLFAGQVSTFQGRRQLAHPEFELLATGESGARAAEFAAELIPVYPASKDITSWQIADSVRLALDALDAPEDPLPAALRDRHGLTGLADALRGIHRPADRADARQATSRLKWDEAFVLQVVLAQRRQEAAAYSAVPRPRQTGGLLDEFDAGLPFELTQGQRQAGETIAGELALDHPMHRLLQGEVGSGKTIIAVRAMLQAVDGGGQAVLLAPTEVLAQQHYRSVSGLLGPLGQAGELGSAEQATRIALLTGSLGAAARRSALLDAASGAAGLVIGTHALPEEQVQFAELGLVVIDEQHRFGVEQRDALRGKAGQGRPHVLVMTATPIPRTVAMTVFGDLEVSTLTELPAGRSPISTHVVPAAEKPRFLERTWQRVTEEVGRGRQVYVVCPRIGDGPQEPEETTADGPDEDGGEGRRPPIAVTELSAQLASGPLDGLRIDVLLTTTVVEVGVDVPNATTMVIMDADRFGVSQLHQLRGRAGRGRHEGLCLLVTESPEGSPARVRLDAVAATLDGFALSRLDLEQRREGDVLGAAQAGRKSSLRLLTLLSDEKLIAAARQEAIDLIEADPALAGQPALAAAAEALAGQQQAEYLEKA